MDAARVTESREIYTRALKEALADGEITPGEQKTLDRIAGALDLSESDKREISQETLSVVMQRVFGEVVADRRVTPAEQAKLSRLATQLGMRAQYEKEIGPQLDKFILLWRVENESLPVLAAGINLQRGEVCHCRFPARWLELRTRTVRTYRTGPVASIRIVKGLHYRVGSYSTHRVTATELQEIDTGTAYITNKRLIFDGRLKNTSIRHSAVIALEAYSDGVGIEKATGRSPVLVTTADAEVVTAIYTEALNRAAT
jgi:hypothetical protein